MHAVGIVLGLIGAVAIVIVALEAQRIEVAPILIYVVGLLAMLALSAAYNMWPITPTKWILRRFDHSAIYLLIAGTYTPFLALMKSSLLSAGFGVLHLENPGESWAGILGAVLIGFFFCLTLRRTGTLWFAIGFHASWDWAESYFYSVPDSGVVFPGHLSNATLAGPAWLTGGSAGPEASVFDFVVLLILFYVFHRLYPAPGPTKTQSASPNSALEL